MADEPDKIQNDREKESLVAVASICKQTQQPPSLRHDGIDVFCSDDPGIQAF